MSMATVLAGLFPPKNTPMEWNHDLNWQPIPIFSQPLDEDNVNTQKYFKKINVSNVIWDFRVDACDYSDHMSIVVSLL